MGEPRQPGFAIRPISMAEFERFHELEEHAFGWPPMPEDARRRQLARLELDRTLAAFDGGTLAGSAASYSFRLSVPGCQLLPAAGVTSVAVLPTRRRRGVLTSLIRRQLDDVRHRGEPLAVLWASEAAIYGRYGYGQASWHAAFSLRRGEGGLTRALPADGLVRLRLADPAAALAELATVYDAVLPGRPGFWARTEAWWQKLIADPPAERQGASALRCVLAEDDGGPRGYAVYRVLNRWDEEHSLPASVLTVRELMAADPAAGAALWADLLGRDLTAEVRADRRPADDPLLYQLADPRRARVRLTDGLWLRIADLPAALAGRRYSAQADAVLEVRDDLVPANAGRWRLRTGPAGKGAGGGGRPGTAAAGEGAGLAAACERVTAEPDVTLDVAQLGAAYLGGVKLAALAGAGLVTEHRPGAVRALSAAFGWDPAPWCPMVF